MPGDELARRVAERIAGTLSGAKIGEDWWLTGWRVEGPDNRWHFTVETDRGNVWLDGTLAPHESLARNRSGAGSGHSATAPIRNSTKTRHADPLTVEQRGEGPDQRRPHRRGGAAGQGSRGR